jgi:hypothetical protein
LRHVTIDTQRTTSTESDIQEQSTDKDKSTLISSVLSQTDQWFKKVARSDFFTGVPRTDASNSKLSEEGSKRKHILECNLKTGIQQNQEVKPKGEQNQSKHVKFQTNAYIFI